MHKNGNFKIMMILTGMMNELQLNWLMPWHSIDYFSYATTNDYSASNPKKIHNGDCVFMSVCVCDATKHI